MIFQPRSAHTAPFGAAALGRFRIRGDAYSVVAMDLADSVLHPVWEDGAVEAILVEVGQALVEVQQQAHH